MLEDDMQSPHPIAHYSNYWSSLERLQDDEDQSTDDDERLDGLSLCGTDMAADDEFNKLVDEVR